MGTDVLKSLLNNLNRDRVHQDSLEEALTRASYN